jgi:hypothetical protein
MGSGVLNVVPGDMIFLRVRAGDVWPGVAESSVRHGRFYLIIKQVDLLRTIFALSTIKIIGSLEEMSGLTDHVYDQRHPANPAGPPERHVVRTVLSPGDKCPESSSPR